MSFSLAKNIDFQVLKRVLGHTIPYRKIFWLTVTLAVLLAPVSTMKPWLINKGVDEYIFKNDPHGLLYIVMLFAVVISIEVIFRYLFIFNSNWLGQSVIRDIRVKLFKHVTSLKLKYFDDTPIGTITTRTVNDIEAINEIFAEGLMTIIADVLMIVVILVVMFLTSVKLTLICLALLPFLLWGSYIFKENVKKAFNRVRNSLATMNAFLQERISGMRIVQIFNAEKGEIEKFRSINRKYTQANLDTILYYAIFFPFVEMISAASLGLMVWWGTRGILDESVTAGTLVAFPIYINMLFRPVRMLADKFNTLQMGLVAADRVFEVLDDERMIENKGQFVPEKIEGKISFDHVWFAYNDDNYVIRDLSFDIKPGESLAIVGSTGSGKTTIINILNRFYEINKGEILIDDISIKEYGLEGLRKRMAIVIQDVFLFTGTVLENITLQSTQFSESDVKRAAELIGADRFIDELPGGYNYKILERGNNLSVGQRQLISFVRAMLFNPDILILDEATSSIDTKTESIIQHAIETLTEKRTSIIIAHRLSTIRNADKILVMQKGKMVEFGSHNELLKNENGPYYQMYHMQFDKSAIIG